MRKFSAVFWIEKHSKSKFRKQGGARWRKEEDDVCCIFSFLSAIVSLCSKRNPCTQWHNPLGITRNEENAVKLCRTGKLCAATPCWVSASLVWNCFASYSQGKKAPKGEGLVQRNRQLTPPLLELNPFAWLKSIVFCKKSLGVRATDHMFVSIIQYAACCQHHLNFSPELADSSDLSFH